MYKKIVFATDFSIRDPRIIDKVCEIIKMNDASLVLCHISQIALIDPTYEIGFSGDVMLEDKDYLHKEIAEILDEFISRGVTDLKFVTDVSLNIAYTITHDVYEKEQNDLIIVVEHKKTGLDRFLGSFALSIAKTSKADVLVIKE